MRRGDKPRVASPVSSMKPSMTAQAHSNQCCYGAAVAQCWRGGGTGGVGGGGSTASAGSDAVLLLTLQEGLILRVEALERLQVLPDKTTAQTPKATHRHDARLIQNAGAGPLV